MLSLCHTYLKEYTTCIQIADASAPCQILLMQPLVQGISLAGDETIRA